MPYNIVSGSGQCPASKPFAVIGGRSGHDLFGCHATKESARKQQQALYAQEDDAGSAGLTEGKSGERTTAQGMPPPVLPVSLPITIAW